MTIMTIMRMILFRGAQIHLKRLLVMLDRAWTGTEIIKRKLWSIFEICSPGPIKVLNLSIFVWHLRYFI